MMPTGDRLDIRAVANAVDLPALMEAEGIAVRRGKAMCPFHANENTPALSVFDRDGRWLWKCHGSCDAAGDAVDWWARYRRIGVAEAARELAERLGIVPPSAPGRAPVAAPAPIPPPAPRPAPEPPAYAAPGWQRDADALVIAAEGRLWAEEGREARGWLRRRGLMDWTIGTLRLGWLPSPGRTEAGIRHEAGIVIPWPSPDGWHSPVEAPTGPRWCGANVRRFDPGFADPTDKRGKYVCWSGSSRGYSFPFADLAPDVPALIVEGELDAALGHQELGHSVNVVSVGGSTQRPRPEALAELARCPLWIVAPDADKAGSAAFAGWFRRDPSRARRAMLPPGSKDLTAAHQAGHDLRRWLQDELDRLGWREPRA